MLITDIG